MTYKICQALFSTNRIDYLTRTLKAQQNLDFRHCKVTKIFFDDYPTGRNNRMVDMLAHAYGYEVRKLHHVNQGITRTWQELFNFVNEHGFDYIWHQEDDTEIMQPVKIIDFIEMLQDDPTLSQVQLKRNNWYPWETEVIGPREDDKVIGNWRMERGNPYFWMMSSLYPAWVAKEPILETTGANPSECTVANWMLDNYGKTVGLVKSAEGNIMVNHIGQYTRGTKLLENEPGWEMFKHKDPSIDYDSQTGEYWNNNA